MSVVATHRLRRLPLAAGLLAAGALVVGLLTGPERPKTATLVLMAAAVIVLAVAVARRGVDLMRTGLAAWLVVGGLMIVSFAALWWTLDGFAEDQLLTFVVLLGIVGLALVVLAGAQLASPRPGATPWQRITGGTTTRASAQRGLRLWAPLLAGLLLILIALRIGLDALFGMAWAANGRAASVPTVFVAALFLAGGAFVVRGAWKLVASADQEPLTTTRDEQVVAAHLHDSVLQTLSLIQRSADDPAKVSQLARQQERSLRGWLAGRDDTATGTLAGAIRLAAEEVEDEQSGVVIDVVAVGDAAMDGESDALLRAGREAMRNAARHGGGRVRVFLEVQEGGARELFVRDTGTGFDPAAIPEERRGVRDAIIGRMRHVGGVATIDSGPSGTEVALRVPTSHERTEP